MNTMIKTLLVGGVALIISGSFSSKLVIAADTPSKDSEEARNFESRKTELLGKIDERIKKMQEHRSCVAAASDRESLKKCRETMHQLMEEKREERREARKEHQEMKKAKKGSN